MADLGVKAESRAESPVALGSFVVTLLGLLLTMMLLFGASQARIAALETRVNDANLPEMRTTIQRIDTNLQDFLKEWERERRPPR